MTTTRFFDVLKLKPSIFFKYFSALLKVDKHTSNSDFDGQSNDGNWPMSIIFLARPNAIKEREEPWLCTKSNFFHKIHRDSYTTAVYIGFKNSNNKNRKPTLQKRKQWKNNKVSYNLRKCRYFHLQHHRSARNTHKTTWLISNTKNNKLYKLDNLKILQTTLMSHLTLIFDARYTWSWRKRNHGVRRCAFRTFSTCEGGVLAEKLERGMALCWQKR